MRTDVVRIMIVVLLSLSGFGLFAAEQAPSSEQLLQLLDYVAVDYPSAVDDGIIISVGEYAEMREFAATIAARIERLPETPERDTLAIEIGQLTDLIERRAPSDEIQALIGSMRVKVIEGYSIAVVPRRTPEPMTVTGLYAANCAICHGVDGAGDGTAAPPLDPAPTNFLERERYLQRSPYGLYSTITLGVAGTGMPSFPTLTEHERWSLAYYVSAMGGANEAATAVNADSSPLADPKLIATLSPSEAAAQYGEAALAEIAWLRAHPAAADRGNETALAITRSLLAESVDAYRKDQHEEAEQLALAAYLDGFEAAENSLDLVDHDLRVDLEQLLTNYRSAIGREAAIGQIDRLASEIDEKLSRADAALSDGSFSNATAFASSFLILLREGLEALLVIAALMAFLVKTKQTKGLPYLHAGWIGALLLGGLTWWVANHFINFSGVAREITESVAALVAAAVLFSVGFWMHGRTQAVQWQKFIRESVEKALGTGSLWGLAGLSFVAAYREVFETILFYQALWVQTESGGHNFVIAGFVITALVLVIVGWLILRYGTRLPLRQFFSVTAIFMVLLAVIFAGKGLSALQEAGKLPISSISFPRIELLGIYPNLQCLGLQAALIMFALLLLVGRQRQSS